MSCRVERLVDNDSSVVLSITGQITGEHVEVLRALLAEETNRIAIDLKDVLLIDREAVELLAARELTGTELRNCPRYIREWLTGEKAETQALAPASKRRNARRNADI